MRTARWSKFEEGLKKKDPSQAVRDHIGFLSFCS
jgi:hypothetical protein